MQEFGLHFMDNLLDLHAELKARTYRHGGYEAFKVNDPKPRDIHKAAVRDRLLHHAIYLVLYPYFDRKFIADSYSCRLRKGTHKARERFKSFASKASRNHTRTAWVQKCDIRKFFASIDHAILKEILAKHIADSDTLWLLGNVIDSFGSTGPGKGLPLGNLTSQLLVNIYMNEFDQFVKHNLRAEYYIRYADDFVFLSPIKRELENFMSVIGNFLEVRLKLSLNPTKCFIKTFASGVDFLGWVHFCDHRVLRTNTRRRVMQNLNLVTRPPSGVRLNSYLGLLRHGNTYKIQQEVIQSVNEDY